MDPDTATEVARQLMAKDALKAHAIDELGIHDFSKVRFIRITLKSCRSRIH